MLRLVKHKNLKKWWPDEPYCILKVSLSEPYKVTQILLNIGNIDLNKQKYVKNKYMYIYLLKYKNIK